MPEALPVGPQALFAYQGRINSPRGSAHVHRPYACPYCPSYATSNTNRLRSHLNRLHTPNRSPKGYHCLMCPHEAVSLSSLKLHLKYCEAYNKWQGGIGGEEETATESADATVFKQPLGPAPEPSDQSPSSSV